MFSPGPFDFNCPGCRLDEVGPRYAVEALVVVASVLISRLSIHYGIMENLVVPSML